MKIKAYNWLLRFTSDNEKKEGKEPNTIKCGFKKFSDRFQAFDDLWSEVMYANCGLCGWDDYVKDREKYPNYKYPVSFERIDDDYKEYEEGKNPFELSEKDLKWEPYCWDFLLHNLDNNDVFHVPNKKNDFQRYTDETRKHILKFLSGYSYIDRSKMAFTSDIEVVPMFRVKDIIEMAQYGNFQYVECGG